MKSLLEGAHKSQIISWPFPYLAIHPAIDPATYKVLSENYPSDEFIFKNSKSRNFGENKRLQLTTEFALRSKSVHPAWREFVHVHSSRNFYIQFCTLFKKHLQKIHPTFAKQMFTIDVGLRSKAKMGLACQIGINSPLKTPSRNRYPHLDNKTQLYGSLFYVRHPEDTSTGGTLEVYESQEGVEQLGGCKLAINAKYMIKKVNEVPYQENTFIMFLNSKRSVHAVSKRSATSFSRRLVNIISETKNNFWQ